MIRDRLVCGITSDAVRKLLLHEDKLTLIKAIDICQINELSDKRIKKLTDTRENQEIHGVRRSSDPKQPNTSDTVIVSDNMPNSENIVQPFESLVEPVESQTTL